MGAETGDMAANGKAATNGDLAVSVDKSAAAKTALGRLWARLRARFECEDLVLWGTFWLHILAFWGIGLSLLAVDRFPAAKRWKIQSAASVAPAQFRKLLVQLFKNQGALFFGVVVLRWLKPRFVSKMCQEMVDRPVPSPVRILTEWWFSLLMNEIFFYFAHGLLHTPMLYKRIHKQHHEFKAPIGLAAEYAHPIEFVLSNIAPGAIGPAILRSHPLSSWAWMVGGLTMTTFHHSGYVFPFYPFKEWTLMHDYHHYSFYSNLGVVGLLDKLFGTDGGADYLAFKQAFFARS